ncbi:hypothetical protein [Neptunitalea lumnitzerae]|uniref:Uncharacterized protein n=1 Tax=Neptunitalea lumnitzerae TaxID=2965509 RepID=A0ABQ5MGC1_9FLAO|nr:hypothetical protein [Neptunitalea sp. Y10]GLB48449.1 hypothetical protein Y10_08170 [Neptunitalea sp. Y10]
MKKGIIIMIATLFLAVACDTKPTVEKNKKEFETVYAETIKVHDEVMAKMGTINKLQVQLEEEVKAATDTVPYAEAMKTLKKGHKGMMDWMHSFSDAFPHTEDRFAGKSKEEIDESVERLKEYKAQMEAVDAQIKEGIDKAEKLLSSN